MSELLRMRHAVPFHDLQVIAAQSAAAPRRQPVVVQGVVATRVRRGRRRVFLPPLQSEGGWLVACGEEIDQGELDELVREGSFVRVASVPMPVDGHAVVLWPVGERPPQVMLLRSAAAEFRHFESEQLRMGDEALEAGDPARALTHYEVVAAACQTPAAYARMLLVNLEPKRRARMMEALAAVSKSEPEQGGKP